MQRRTRASGLLLLTAASLLTTGAEPAGAVPEPSEWWSVDDGYESELPYLDCSPSAPGDEPQQEVCRRAMSAGLTRTLDVGVPTIVDSHTGCRGRSLVRLALSPAGWPRPTVMVLGHDTLLANGCGGSTANVDVRLDTDGGWVVSESPDTMTQDGLYRWATWARPFWWDGAHPRVTVSVTFAMSGAADPTASRTVAFD